MPNLSQGFPQLNSPISGPRGAVTIPWYQFFITLWNRTGGAQNLIISLLSPPTTAGQVPIWQGSGFAPEVIEGDVSVASSGASVVEAIQTEPVDGTTGTTNVVFSEAPEINEPTITGTADMESATFTGSLTPDQTAGITGTNTDNDANAGSVGEYQEALVAKASPVSLVTDTPKDIVSLDLTPGDWDVEALAGVVGTVLTQLSYYNFDISLVSDTQNTDGTSGSIGSATALTDLTGRYSWATGAIRIKLAAPTTIYLVAKCGFTASTLGGYGTLSARRRR